MIGGKQTERPNDFTLVVALNDAAAVGGQAVNRCLGNDAAANVQATGRNPPSQTTICMVSVTGSTFNYRTFQKLHRRKKRKNRK